MRTDEWYWFMSILPVLEFIRDHPRTNIQDTHSAFYDKDIGLFKYSMASISTIFKVMVGLGVFDHYNSHPFEVELSDKGKRLIIVMNAKFKLRYTKIGVD